MQRPSLENPAHEWFKWLLGKVDRLAVHGVRPDTHEAASDLLGFLVEPAARRGIELIIGAKHALDDLNPDGFVEEEFGYAYSFERLLWCLRGGQPTLAATRMLAETSFTPDETQKQATLHPQTAEARHRPAARASQAVGGQSLVHLRATLERRSCPGL